jgi:hypothetical protein
MGIFSGNLHLIIIGRLASSLSIPSCYIYLLKILQATKKDEQTNIFILCELVHIYISWICLSFFYIYYDLFKTVIFLFLISLISLLLSYFLNSNKSKEDYLREENKYLTEESSLLEIGKLSHININISLLFLLFFILLIVKFIEIYWPIFIDKENLAVLNGVCLSIKELGLASSMLIFYKHKYMKFIRIILFLLMLRSIWIYNSYQIFFIILGIIEGLVEYYCISNKENISKILIVFIYTLCIYILQSLCLVSIFFFKKICL